MTIILLLLLTLCGCTKEEAIATDVEIKHEDGFQVTIKKWTDEEGKQFVFLPSYYNGTYESNGEVQYVQSENVATLYINTESGSMDSIHEDKEYRESAEAYLYTQDGTLDFNTTACSLKGRGKTTWELFEKKPYQLKLEESANLLGMGKGEKWILLANAFDETNLRNKFIYALARENDFCYAPECEFVDLYLNGEYRGLYLLAERVEFGEDRLNVDAEEAYMCNVEVSARWDELDNAFRSASDRAVEIREPDDPTEQDYERITEIVNVMEDAIFYPEKEPFLEDMIDIDSWAYKYLIDEIMENGDADIASSYFYYADGKIYAGPLWDYDNTLGVSTRNQNPCTFLAKSGYQYINHETPYYDALNANEVFYNRMVELYKTKMLPALQEKIETELLEEEELISNAVAMNRIRWANAFDAQNSEIRDVQGIVDYLGKRIKFLNTAWLAGETYYTIQFEPYVIDMYATPETYAGSYAVKPEEYFTGIIEDGVVWIDCETGERFDPSKPITRNMTLRLEVQ